MLLKQVIGGRILQVKIGNSNIYYEVLGEGNPVILLHGWLTDMETMRPIANSLMQNFKVLLIVFQLK